jgi:cyclase
MTAATRAFKRSNTKRPIRARVGTRTLAMRTSRLPVSASLLLLCMSPIVRGQTKHDPPSDLFGVRILKVADGVYVAQRPEPLRLFVDGNTTIITNDTDVVVVDAGGTPQTAHNVIKEIRKLTPLPVRYVISTHIHRDHRFGLQEYVRAFPGVEIVAHPGVKEIVDSTHPKYLTDTVARMEAPPQATEEAIARLRSTRPPGHEAVVAHLERFKGRDIHALRSEYRTLVNVPPTVTVDKTLTLHRGRRRIEVMHIGAGDTPHDLIVRLPEDRVVITGDMVVHPFPYGYSDQPLRWLETLRTLASFEFGTLVPGHGDPQAGKGYLRSVIDLLDAVQTQARTEIHAGRDARTIRSTMDVSAFESALPNDPVTRYYFREYFLDPHVDRVVRALGAPGS